MNEGDRFTSPDRRQRPGKSYKVGIFYSTTEGVRRKIATVKMAQVMDFPVCCTEQMKETDLRLLIEGDVPGKVIQAAVYF